MDVCASIAPSGEIQDTGLPRVLVEAQLSWGGDVLSATHVKIRGPRNELLVSDLGFEVPTGHDLVIAKRGRDGALSLQLPNGTEVPPGYVMTLHLGGTSLRLALVADDIVVPLRFRPDARFALGVIAAASLHIAVMGFLAAGRAPAGAEEDAARATMQGLLTRAEQRAAAELARLEEESLKAKLEIPAKGEAAARKEKEGSAGNPARTDDGGRAKDARGESRHAVAGQRQDAPNVAPGKDEIASFGLLAILDNGRSVTAGLSPWAVAEGPSAMGSIFGTTIHDAAGVGGLGLSSAGEGAGGRSEQVELGGISSLGKVGGNGVGQGFGCCGGRATPRREHEPRFGFRFGDERSVVNGRLPPEAVQRIVRQSSGRIRACYATALQRDPSLEGRVSTKFVIDRSGAVVLAANVENELADAQVASCVTRAFSSMSFPEPEGGIVTVVYPVIFTRSEP
ncbi:MAG: AgmX/PglI C-terminal domain-containing protein [Deltaproteobacteria bacterium]|nr:AgmX/PglI C-terminal domain-containing protein [Deltaproteobacteria bacterium]